MDVTFNLNEILERLDRQHEISLESVKNSHIRRKQRTEKTILFLQEATGSGLSLKIPMDLDCPTFRLTLDAKDDWRVLHSIVGELEQYTIEPHGDDLRKRLVEVTLRPKAPEFKHINFVYVRKLAKDDKCKIVRQKSSYVSVQCSA